MKTIANIIDMKNTSHQFWGTAYLCFIERLADYYLSKSDGQERIFNELKDWDADSQGIIIKDLADNLLEQGFELTFEFKA